MNIGAVSGNLASGATYQAPTKTARPTGFEQALQTISTTPNVDPLAPHILTPGDPLQKYLTTEDLANLKNLYNVSFTAEGQLTGPMMDIYQMTGVEAAIGQLASDRAHGTVSGRVSPDALQQLVSVFKSRLESGQPIFSEGDDPLLDLLK